MSKNIHAWLVGIIALGMASAACGGSSPNSPSTPGSGSSPSSTSMPAAGSEPRCRTAPKTQRSVQTFVDGQVVTTDTSCTFDGSTEVVCSNVFVDSVGGPGTGTQTTRFASKADIIDEAVVNPPVSRSLGTTTVIEVSGVSFTTTATNTYDTQMRLVETTITNPPPIGGESNLTYSEWDSSGRPTAGTSSLAIGPSGPITITYDDAAHTVRRDIPPNICTVTHDEDGNMIREECTGTTASTTVVTILDTQEICK